MTTPFRRPDDVPQDIAAAIQDGFSIVTVDPDSVWTRLNGTTLDPREELRLAGVPATEAKARTQGRQGDVLYRDPKTGKRVVFPVAVSQADPRPRQARVIAMEAKYGDLDAPAWLVPLDDRDEFLRCRIILRELKKERGYGTILGRMDVADGVKTFTGVCKIPGCGAPVTATYRPGDKRRPPAYCSDECRAEARRATKRASKARARSDRLTVADFADRFRQDPAA